MQYVAEMFKYACLGTIGVVVMFLVLLALPKSRLSALLLRMYGWLMSAATVGLVLYILSPLDVLPDLIPLLGQVDDVASVVVALFTGVTAFFSLWEGQRIQESLPEDTDRPRLPLF